MTKRTRIIMAAVAIVAVVGVAAALTLGSKGGGPTVDAAQVAQQTLDVTVMGSGSVETGVQTDLFPATAGVIDTLYVADGDEVKEGDVIASLDTGALSLGVKQAKSAVAAAKAQLAAAKQGYTSAADLAAAKAQVAATKQTYETALAAWDAYPFEDATQTALGVAKDQTYAAYMAASSALERASKSASAAQVAAAKAGLAQADAALALAQDNLDAADLKAPSDGIVVFNNPSAALGGGKIREGSSVSPAAAPFSVVDMSSLKFVAEVDEVDISHVKVGMFTDVTLDALPGQVFTSKVTRVNPIAQTTATGGTVFEVEIALENAKRDILVGMKGDATVKVSSQPNALTIPIEALFSEGSVDYAYVIGADNKLKKTEITVGDTTDTEVEVVKGLSAGQNVALSGATQYTDGMAVRIKQP